MSESKKMSRKMRLAITSITIGMYIAYVVLLFWYHPFVVSAKDSESIPGGSGNYVEFDYTADFSVGKQTYTYKGSVKVKVKDGYELVGYISGQIGGGYNPSYNTLGFHLLDISANKMVNFDLSSVSEFYVTDDTYLDGVLTSSFVYTLDDLKFPNTMYYQNGFNPNYKIISNISGCKLFKDLDALDAYVKTGSFDGLVNPSIDMGLFDKDIGYLHDLKHKGLQYGEIDENGIPESFSDYFTWSDYYPEYDDSYLVEVRASCQVETKKWFGLSKGTTYTSDIRNIANGIRYKDLEWTIDVDEETSVFADFINEHMPDNNSLSSFGAVGAFRIGTYYFRIYRWDETIKSYRYGMWVRLTSDGSVLMGSINNSIDAGYFDSNGNWVTDKDSSYGEGKPGSAIVGSGDNKDDAKADADKKEDEIDSGDNKIDLSNTNFMELWNWFCKCLVSFWNGVGVIPEFFGRVFSFLPAPVYGFIGIGIVGAIILRILGR